MIDEKKLIEKTTTFGERMTKNGMQGDFHLKIIKAITRIIEEQPKVGEWIPCSERFPEEPDVQYIIASKYGEVDVATYDGLRYWDEYNPDEVIAWMPLLEPYKGGE